MNSAVCTLFEGGYHLGLAAFVNSLHACGYRGGVWAGYRGPLPPWAGDARPQAGAHTLAVAEGLDLHFVPVETPRHLTNFKPDFLQLARSRFFPQAGHVFYFDPDIVIRASWSFFESWAQAGIALCEDINSPMPATHPIRRQWEEFYRSHGYATARALDIYVNGGFVGVTAAHWPFIELWQRLQDLMAPHAGQLAGWNYPTREHRFQKTDQDALNMAAMFSPLEPSIVGKDGMDLMPGGFIMAHALGAPKPWARHFVREALRGFPPTPADRAYWEHAGGPLVAFPPREIARQQNRLRLAAALGRFIRRN